MKRNINFQYASVTACILLIVCCFLPWVRFNNIGITFSGYNVTKFPSGVYYGKAGVVITVFAVLIILMNLWKKKNARNANLFFCALLIAYTIRTYILFTGSLFEGEVTSLPGIYLVILLSFVLMVCALFPREYTVAQKEN